MNEKLPSSEASSGVSMANPLTSNPSPSYGIPSISPTNIRIAHPSLSAPLAPTSGGYLHSLQGGSNLFNHPRNINLSANITHPSYHTSSSSLPAPTHTALTAEEIEAARKRILLEEEAEREAKVINISFSLPCLHLTSYSILIIRKIVEIIGVVNVVNLKKVMFVNFNQDIERKKLVKQVVTALLYFLILNI